MCSCLTFLHALPQSAPAVKRLKERIADFVVLYNDAGAGFEPHARNVLLALASETTHVHASSQREWMGRRVDRKIFV